MPTELQIEAKCPALKISSVFGVIVSFKQIMQNYFSPLYFPCSIFFPIVSLFFTRQSRQDNNNQIQ